MALDKTHTHMYSFTEDIDICIKAEPVHYILEFCMTMDDTGTAFKIHWIYGVVHGNKFCRKGMKYVNRL